MPTMPTYVRVKQPETGHEISMVASAANAAGLKPLDKPAVKPDGTPLPAKDNQPLSNLSSTKGRKATTKGRKAAPERKH